VRELASEQLEEVPGLLYVTLADGRIGGGNQFLEPPCPGPGSFAASGFLVLLVLFGEEGADIWVLREEALSVLAPGLGQFGEGLLNLAGLDNCGLGHGTGITPESALVDG